MKKLTCSYGNTFKFDMVEQKGEPIMVIDANIKEYVIHVGHDAGTYDFPMTVVVNDKLYLNRQLKDELLETLDNFIETTYIQHPAAEKNARGFKCLNPTDIYGNTISIQESSNMVPAIWFGVDIKTSAVLVWKDNQLKTFEYPSHDILLQDRLHLKMPQAKKLKKMIISLWKKYEEVKN